ncbi:MAG: macro domain-containing protein [Myxococcota bacterium]
MQFEVVWGDLLDQTDVDAIVNAWNRNLIPWWLLLPQGVSGAIKRRGGTAPFRELGRRMLPLGQARVTSAGNLPFRGIIHVAGIDLLWRASERSIVDSVQNAVLVARDHGFSRIAMPVIGAGSGRFDEPSAARLICDTLEAWPSDSERFVRVVRFTQSGW